MVPLIWLIAGIVLLAGEMLAGEFVLAMLGVGALAAAGGSAAFGLEWLGSSLVFAVASVLLLLGVRPALKRRAQKSIEGYQQHSEKIVGSSAVVSRRVDGHGGRVRIGPDEWSARAFLDEQVMEPGERVTVMRIEGATALVLAE
ncbi:NfeD family protein [Pseudonocardia pini]|jgi:membrane protein implicated in regulation of membrane protease activity|uniref:NfeD family protein n=1 Tax=Pseudonocardia pini TaxID=2758030 RepID=UPI0015F0F0B7|nr:NfeD family protein [Pseudonocardia pini]